MKNKTSLILFLVVAAFILYYVIKKTKGKEANNQKETKTVTTQSGLGGLVSGILSSPALGAFAGAALAAAKSDDD